MCVCVCVCVGGGGMCKVGEVNTCKEFCDYLECFLATRTIIHCRAVDRQSQQRRCGP